MSRLFDLLSLKTFDFSKNLADVGLVGWSQPFFRTNVLMVGVGGNFWMTWGVIVSTDVLHESACAGEWVETGGG